MVLENINQIFSKMDWLDKPIKDGMSQFYTKIFYSIRKKQNTGIIPLNEYKQIGGIGTVEYGYYMANIAFELGNYDEEEYASLQDRILFFIQNVSQKLFEYDDSWFRSIFYKDYSKYLREKYTSEEGGEDLEYYVYEYKNTKEKEIYDFLWNKYLKKEYFKEKNDNPYWSKEINQLFLDAEIIDIDDFISEADFKEACKHAIAERVAILKRYQVLHFSECKNHHLFNVNKLKGIIIYCGKFNYDLQDEIFHIIDKITDSGAWEIKYGIRLFTDY